MDNDKHATPLGDLADKLDAGIEIAYEWRLTAPNFHQKLTGWVFDSPTASNTAFWTSTFMGGPLFAFQEWSAFQGKQLAGGMVDVLRLGDGWAKGGWGYVEDGLRVTALAPVFGRVANRIRVAVGSRLARRFARQPTGSAICTWMTGVRTLGESGIRLSWSRNRAYAILKELTEEAAKQGLNLRPFPYRIGLEDLIPALRRFGIEAKHVGSFLETLDHILTFTRRNPRGVVAFTVEYGGESHTLYAQGGRFTDTTGEVFESVAQFQRRYPGAALLTEHGGPYFIPHATAIHPIAKTAGLAGILGLALKPATIDVLGSEEQVAASPPVIPPPPAPLLPPQTHCMTVQPYDGPTTVLCLGMPRTYVIKNGDFPSKIAQKVYGNPALWPRIYHANRSLIGPNPYSNFAWKPGLVLTIP
jgi:hypothetical protein